MDKPVRLAHVLNGLARGGNENLCLQLIHHSPPQVEHLLINLDPSQRAMQTQFEASRIQPIIECPHTDRGKLPFVLALAQCLRQAKPDVVLIQPFGLHILVGLAAKLARIPIIVTRAGNPPPSEPTAQRQWRTLIQLSRLLGIPIHACSQATHNSLARLAKLPSRSYPIPNGCDVAAIAAQAHQAKERVTASPILTIGMVARLNAIKDQATLIQALAQLPAHPPCQLWLIGDGPEAARLQHLCQTLGVDDQVTFWGARSDVPRLLGQLDIYAFSTTADEGFGIALIEAMAAGLPIIASDVPACREVLNAGAAGILVPPQDAPALAAAIADLMPSPPARATWGQRAYAHAAQHYSIQTCAQRWYDRLLPPETAHAQP
jgi:glycosyltransferase involved in cell wall biosynthesis